MSENRKEFGNVPGLDDDAFMSLRACNSDLEMLRRITKESFEENDAKEDTFKSEEFFVLAGVGFAAGGDNLEAMLDSLENEQMKQDCKAAIILAMSGKDPVDVGMMKLLLKGVIMPLAEELKNARRTIESLMIATGKKEKAKE